MDATRQVCIAASLSLWLTGSLLGPAYSQNCAEGERYYQQAQAETDPARRLDLLEPWTRTCPTFEGWYLTGLSHQQLSQAAPALAAFQKAQNLAGDDQAQALVMGRIGQVLAAQGKSLEAVQLLRRAVELAPNSPPWIAATLRTLDIQQAEGIVPAAEIHDALASRASFGVVPAVHLRVHFAFDKATLDERGQRQVDELARALDALRDKVPALLIIGHTDQRGSDDYNQRLSECRALTVRRDIERQYPVLGPRLCSEGRGERELLYRGDTEADHQLNRRVEVRVVQTCAGSGTNPGTACLRFE